MSEKAPDQDQSREPSLGAALFVGAGALLVSIAASVMLVVAHFTSMALPGCAAGSSCQQLTEGPWGRIPGLGLPVSLIGLAWFVAALAGWLASRRTGPRTPFLWIVRLGALVSLAFIVVMAVKGSFCLYCATAHAGNLVFWITVERSRRPAVRTGPATVVTTVVFVAALTALYGAELARSAQIGVREARELAESKQRIIDAGSGGETKAFTGRYRIGPANAAVRVVVISDYMCPNCAKIDQEVRAILKAHPEVSFSAKHYPFCTECNENVKDCTEHWNACRAASAAEAAGLLKGEEAFWAMHHWLFDRRGEFDDAQLEGYLAANGYDVAEFLRMMNGERVLKLIQDDTREAKTIGLFSTPMIFVNGVELKGFRRNGALTSTVEEVAASNPEPKSAVADRPPTAAEKFVDDWRKEVRRSVIPGPGKTWTRAAAAEPRANIVVWGDLADDDMAELNTAIRALLETRDDVTYSFLHYPLNKQCNPYTKVAADFANAMACTAARAAEAAGALGGEEAYWRMHDWLLANHAALTNQSIAGAAVAQGLDREAFHRTINSPAVIQSVSDDTRTALGAGIGRFMPALFVNQRGVPRWKLEGHDVLGAIVDEARRQGIPPPPAERPRRRRP